MKKHISLTSLFAVLSAPLTGIMVYNQYESTIQDQILITNDRESIIDIVNSTVDSAGNNEKDVDNVKEILSDIKQNIDNIGDRNYLSNSNDIYEEDRIRTYRDYLFDAFSVFDLEDESNFDSEEDKIIPDDVSLEFVISGMVEKAIEIADNAYAEMILINENINKSDIVDINASILSIGNPESEGGITTPVYTGKYSSLEVGDIIDFWGYQDDSWVPEGTDTEDDMKNSNMGKLVGHTATIIDWKYINGMRNYEIVSSKPSVDGVYHPIISANRMEDYLNLHSGSILRVGRFERVDKWYQFPKWEFKDASISDKNTFVQKINNLEDGGEYDHDFAWNNNKWYCSEITGAMYRDTKYNFTMWFGIYSPREISYSYRTRWVSE